MKEYVQKHLSLFIYSVPPPLSPTPLPPLHCLFHCIKPLYVNDRLPVWEGMGRLHVCSHTSTSILLFTEMNCPLSVRRRQYCSSLLQHVFGPFQETCKYTKRQRFRCCIIWYIRKKSGVCVQSLESQFTVVINPAIPWGLGVKEHVELPLT